MPNDGPGRGKHGRNGQEGGHDPEPDEGLEDGDDVLERVLGPRQRGGDAVLQGVDPRCEVDDSENDDDVTPFNLRNQQDAKTGVQQQT